ncbi:hypothetical protein D3C74_251280 [compost metagenome]
MEHQTLLLRAHHFKLADHALRLLHRFLHQSDEPFRKTLDRFVLEQIRAIFEPAAIRIGVRVHCNFQQQIKFSNPGGQLYRMKGCVTDSIWRALHILHDKHNVE